MDVSAYNVSATAASVDASYSLLAISYNHVARCYKSTCTFLLRCETTCCLENAKFINDLNESPTRDTTTPPNPGARASKKPGQPYIHFDFLDLKVGKLVFDATRSNAPRLYAKTG